MLFDLDGTLVDSRPGIVAAINATLRALGEPERPAPELERFIGPPLHETFGTLLGDRSPDGAGLDEIVAEYRDRYRLGMVAGSTVYPGITELLDALAAAGRPLAVATSKARTLAVPLLEGLGLAGRFRVIAGPVPPARDDKAQTIAQALTGLGATAADAPVMIGDRHHDIDGGRAHGLRTIGAAWGFGGEAELREAGADDVAADPAAVRGLLGV